MMNRLFLVLAVSLSLACNEPQKKVVSAIQQKKVQQGVKTKQVNKIRKISKLEQLRRLPKGSVISCCDLSNDNIRRFPNLSAYTIKSLNLSHNQLDTVIINYLPKGLVRLDLSYNLLKKDFILTLDPKNKFTTKELRAYYKAYVLREINVSHNQITWLDIDFPVYKIIASHNNLSYIIFNHRNIQYVDISYNPNLSNEVDFVPEKIDTIIRVGISNDKPLEEVGKLKSISSIIYRNDSTKQ